MVCTRCWLYDMLGDSGRCSVQRLALSSENSVQLTMSNVENKSLHLWVHCLMTWIVSAVVYRVSEPARISCFFYRCNATPLTHPCSVHGAKISAGIAVIPV